MAIIFAGEVSPELKHRNIAHTLSLYCTYADYMKNVLTNEDVDRLNLAIKQKKLDSEILGVFNNNPEKEIEIENNLWGFDYVFRIKSAEESQIKITTNNISDSAFSSVVEDCNVLLEEMNDATDNICLYEYTEDHYFTTTAIIELNVDTSWDEIQKLCRSISYNINRTSIYERWIHVYNGWCRSRSKEDYDNINKDIYIDPEDGYYAADSLFFKNEAFEFEENGNIYKSKTDYRGFVMENEITKFISKKELDDPLNQYVNRVARLIYIPEGKRCAIGGWIKFNNIWRHFSEEDYLASDTAIIDGKQYTLEKGKLMANADLFYLDDNGKLHNK